MIKIILFNPLWFKASHGNLRCYVRGWAEYSGEILTAEKIADVIHSEYFDTNKAFDELPELLNGNFSIIISDQKETMLISDRMRSYPLIYFAENHSFVVTDDIIQYQKNIGVTLPLDEITCEQFLCSNYIIGLYTLFEDVYSTQAGEIVTIGHASKQINRKQYFQWSPNMKNDESQRDYEAEAIQLDEIFKSVFNRMIRSAPYVNNWIIPLSGGYDSRTIVNYLYKMGIKNVICFTYGMQGNIQSVISRQVAEALGYEWHFIDYQIWTQKMNAQNILSAYLTYGFNGSSVSHLQDFPAVYALKEMSIIKENDIFVPGHALDFIAGSHLNHPMRTCNSIESVIPVIRKHFSDFSYHSMKRTAVFRHVHSVIGNYNLNPAQMAECFVWQERQTKFIANSVKVYEYFGYSWRIPEWDLELINYWEKIGFNYRYERNMFKSIFKKYLMMDLLRSIPFANDLYVKPKQTFKSIVSNNIPLWMKQAIKRTGITTSTYCVNEGSHLIHSDNSETIADYLSSFNAPMIVRKYLKPYFRKQNLARFGINTVTTLLNIRSTSSSYEPHINHFSHTILRKREPN